MKITYKGIYAFSLVRKLFKQKALLNLIVLLINNYANQIYPGSLLFFLVEKYGFTTINIYDFMQDSENAHPVQIQLN